MKYVIDMDGVLADFNTAFRLRFPDPSIFPPVGELAEWDWPSRYASPTTVETVWQEVWSDPSFWKTLPVFPWTAETLDLLNRERTLGHEVYYVTQRHGVSVKTQTETWLQAKGAEHPTVLCVLKHKGGVIRNLDADVAIDDRPLHLHHARRWGKPGMRIYMQQHCFNRPLAEKLQDQDRIIPVESPIEALNLERVRRVAS